MELNDQIRINAPRAQVFKALNDPEILRQAIPGCEELNALSPTEFAATVAAKIGPLSAKFKGSVALADIVTPVSYTLSGEGKGGPAGFAKVRASVALAEDGAATLLSYTVQADIGGKLGQLGGALVDRTAQKLAGEFFEKFNRLVAPASEPAAVAPSAAPAPTTRLPIWWIAAAAMAAILAWYLLHASRT
ncbi:MAG: carbon monoxide dehydrogenase subunit G [Gammaproteobacteria bacterium]|nr:carbon monoxide dehydrogenase subunit G [Gammaproteobacteria bacterium]